MEDEPQTTSTDKIAEELVCWAGSGTLIIDHMARWPSTGRAEASAPETFGRLVRETLAPLAGRHAAADLATAASVLADAVETLGSEIYLVDPSVLEEEEEEP